MNESQSELLPLDQETLRLVAQHDPVYQAYVDALALMHDLVCEYADSAEKPRLAPAQIEAQQGNVLNNLNTERMNGNAESLVGNLTDNFRLAWEIRNRVEHSESPDERFEAELRATQFLNSLLQTYTTLRILKQNREPARS